MAKAMSAKRFDWALEADFVLINSTALDVDLMTKIEEKASMMQKGSFLITISKSLPSLQKRGSSAFGFRRSVNPV
jgi:hypothetical protein